MSLSHERRFSARLDEARHDASCIDRLAEWLGSATLRLRFSSAPPINARRRARWLSATSGENASCGKLFALNVDSAVESTIFT